MTSGRRRRIWVTTGGSVALSIAGQAGQKSISLRTDFENKTGVGPMAGCTIARTHVCFLPESGSGDATSGIHRLMMGVGVYTELIDDADFPNVVRYDGDWLAWECAIVKMPGAASTVVLGLGGDNVRVDSRAMRKIPRTDGTPFIVFGLDTAPTGLTVQFVVSQLILLP